MSKCDQHKLVTHHKEEQNAFGVLEATNLFFVPNKRRSVQKALIRRRSSAKSEWNNKRRATSIRHRRV